jgi:hypothetical protein
LAAALSGNDVEAMVEEASILDFLEKVCDDEFFGLLFWKFCQEDNLRVYASNVETVVEVSKRPPFGSPLHTYLM